MDGASNSHYYSDKGVDIPTFLVEVLYIWVPLCACVCVCVCVCLFFIFYFFLGCCCGNMSR
jgi:hypothetical protein